MNVRINKMKTKQLYKIHDRYYNNNTYHYYGTDYEINEDPRLEQPKPLAKSVEEIIYMDPNNCHLIPEIGLSQTLSSFKNQNFHLINMHKM